MIYVPLAVLPIRGNSFVVTAADVAVVAGIAVSVAVADLLMSNERQVRRI